MKVLISGGSGLVGTALTQALRAEGHTVAHLVRPGGDASPGDVRWDPASSFVNLDAMTGTDAVVNLNGASIGGGRWSPPRKKLLRSSRIDSSSRRAWGWVGEIPDCVAGGVGLRLSLWFVFCPYLVRLM